jgi:hypothetical protein
MLPESEMRHGFGGYTFCYVHAALGFCEFLYFGAKLSVLQGRSPLGYLAILLPRKSAP